jgi:endonuclease/exonuclease/phosphatase family metal-dependent hydrolase
MFGSKPRAEEPAWSKTGRPGQGCLSAILRHRWSILIGLILLGLLVSVWVLNVSTVGTHVEGCSQGCVILGERRDGPLRVISLNVLHGFPRFEHLTQRLDLIADEIRRQDADIVCLQEVPWVPQVGSGAKHLAERAGLNYLYLRANGNRWAILFEEGEAILSRYPLKDPAFAELKPRAGFFENRAVLHATAVTPWGDVRVFVTHLTNASPEINRAQTMSLMSFVTESREGPVIVAGDFNATEDSPQIKAITDQWIDTYRAIHPDQAGATCCIENLSHGPDEPLETRIDYVFLVPEAGQDVRILSSQRVLDRPFMVAAGWQWASDHVGLLTVFEIDR